MSSFLFTPMTRFYAEALEYMKNVAGGAVKEDGTSGGFGGSRRTQTGKDAVPETLQGQCGISL